uniref:Uncharacterized protein n=1 Tax=Oryza nivara TaxID=4536 RepID=A0A0E0HSV2_ORYNI
MRSGGGGGSGTRRSSGGGSGMRRSDEEEANPVAPRCVDGHGGGGCSVDERLRAGGEVAADRAAALRPMRADPATAGWIWRDGGCSSDGWLRARGAEATSGRRGVSGSGRCSAPHARGSGYSGAYPARLRAARPRIQCPPSSHVEPEQVTTAGRWRDGGGSVRRSTATRKMATFAAVSLSSGIHGGAATGTSTTRHRRFSINVIIIKYHSRINRRSCQPSKEEKRGEEVKRRIATHLASAGARQPVAGLSLAPYIGFVCDGKVAPIQIRRAQARRRGGGTDANLWMFWLFILCIFIMCYQSISVAI